MRVIDVCCRWPGSAHDATLFVNSTLCNKLEMGVLHNDSLLVADSAYGHNHYMCKPLDNPQTVPERRYEKAQIKTRNVAERRHKATVCMSPKRVRMQLGKRTRCSRIILCAVQHDKNGTTKPK